MTVGLFQTGDLSFASVFTMLPSEDVFGIGGGKNGRCVGTGNGGLQVNKFVWAG